MEPPEISVDPRLQRNYSGKDCGDKLRLKIVCCGTEEARLFYSVFTTVNKIEPFDDGWYVNFEGSYESICFGQEHPNFAVGDVVKITFEKQEPQNAQPE